jgi:hypothetical protein
VEYEAGVNLHGKRAVLIAMVAGVVAVGCERSTGTLDDEHQKRFETEGIVRRAVDLDFRRTRLGDASRTRWRDGDASIVVTRQSVVIHSGDRFLFEITPRSTGRYRVARERDRVTLQGGRGQSRVSWSFRPPDDPAGWTEDVRAVIRGAAANADDRPRS